MLNRRATIAVAVAALLLVAGCSQSPGLSFQKPGEVADAEARAAMTEIYGTPAEDWQTNVAAVDDSMSESHRVMAIMMLKGEGLNSDLESYREVYLIDVKSSDSSEVTKVLVVEDANGVRKTIAPQRSED